MGPLWAGILLTRGRSKVSAKGKIRLQKEEGGANDPLEGLHRDHNHELHTHAQTGRQSSSNPGGHITKCKLAAHHTIHELQPVMLVQYTKPPDINATDTTAQ